MYDKLYLDTLFCSLTHSSKCTFLIASQKWHIFKWFEDKLEILSTISTLLYVPDVMFLWYSKRFLSLIFEAFLIPCYLWLFGKEIRLYSLWSPLSRAPCFLFECLLYNWSNRAIVNWMAHVHLRLGVTSSCIRSFVAMFPGIESEGLLKAMCYLCLTLQRIKC